MSGAVSKKPVFLRRLVWVLGLVLLIIILLVSLLLFNVNSTIRIGGSTIVSKLTGGQTTIGDVSVSLLRGQVLLKDIIIKNPTKTIDGKATDFATEDFFKLGLLKIDLDTASLFSDVIHVREIIVESPFISYEKTPLSDSNHHVLMAHINKATAGDKVREEKDKTEEKESSKKVIIDHLLMSNGTVNLSTFGISAPIPLPTIELRDLGKEKQGVSVGTAVAESMNAMFAGVVSVVKNVGKWGRDTSHKAVKGGGNVLQSLGDVFKDTGNSLKDAGKNLKKGGKGLYKSLTK